MASDLTKTLLLEETASPKAVGDALFRSVTGPLALPRALVTAGALGRAELERQLARSPAPVMHKVEPLEHLLARLPSGLTERLLALPVRHDAITGTVDVVTADSDDLHVAHEIAFHLEAPVRLLRAPLTAIEDALARLRARQELARAPAPPRYSQAPATIQAPPRPPADTIVDAELPPATMREPPPVAARNTPPWGTPIHPAHAGAPSEPPRSGLGSEIPIPLMRRTWHAVSGGTQRPPPARGHDAGLLGEGYPVDAGALRSIVEVQNERGGLRSSERVRASRHPVPGDVAMTSIPAPPLVPRSAEFSALVDASAPTLSRQVSASPPSDAEVDERGGVLGALRSAGSRDEILELVLTGARAVARRAAIFAVKKSGYVGWTCTPEFGDAAALTAVTIPGHQRSVFDLALESGLYLGPIRADDLHVELLGVMGSASRDVAVVPVRVSGKPTVLIVADELRDTMFGTRLLEELARAAAEAFARLVRKQSR